MALTFAKKAAAATATQAPAQQEAAPPQDKPKASGGMSFMKRGADAKKAAAEEEYKAEERRAAANRMRPFKLGYNEDCQITFLDGKLDADGVLDIPRYYEHTIQVGGDWKTFVCTAEIDTSQPCPICAMNTEQSRRSLVGVMTVIDHTPHTILNGPNKGKVIQNTRKLFVAKRLTIKLLTKYAVKRGGLAGCTFDVSRPDEKNAAVGESFDFVQKFGSLSEIAAKWSLKLEDVQPANYEEEFTFRTPEQLIALGVHKAQLNTKGYKSGKTSNLKDDL